MKKVNMRMVLVNVMGFCLARASIMGLNPIAVAYFTATYTDKKMRVAIFPVILLGIATKMPVIDVVKYGIIMLVTAIMIGIFEGKDEKLPESLVAIMSGTITALLGLTKGVLNIDMKYYATMAILEGIVVFTLIIILCKGIKHILYTKSNKPIGNQELVSVAIIVAASVYGIPENLLSDFLLIDFALINFSLIEGAIYFAILYLGYKYGSGAGAISGATCGVVIGLQNGSVGNVGVMCVIGILAGMFREIGRLGTALGYSVGVILIGYFYDDSLLILPVVRALVSGVLLFLLLPKNMVMRVDNNVSNDSDDIYIRKRLQKHRQSRLMEFAESFNRLSRTFNTTAEKKINFSRQEMNDIFDELTNSICKKCDKCNECWQSNFYDTYKDTYSMLSSAEKNGVIYEKDIPEMFLGKCIQFKSFLWEINRVFEIAKLNLTWNNRMAESREAVAGQLSEVADIINEFSLDLYETVELEETKENKIISILLNNNVQAKKIVILEKKNKKSEIYITARTEKGRCVTTKEVASHISQVMGKRMRPSESTKNIISREYDTCIFVEDTNFKLLTGTARIPKDNEKISGDNFSFIHLNCGQTVMMLSDGMGSGFNAYRESESVIELMEQLMEAGFKEKSAIKLINSVLVLKSDQQSFSTIDLSVIDQYTGVCEFIKIGASTTFIKRDNWVETIKSTTLPIGVFNQVDFDSVSKKLYDGDFIIMVTDGIIDSMKEDDKEGVLEKIIMNIKSNKPQDIANTILKVAMEQNDNKAVDDMTVLVAGIWKK